MPQIANITVKDASNVDVVFTALTPSSGDTTQAQWRALGAGTVPTNARAMATRTQYNGPKNGRAVHVNAVFPFVQMVNGVETVVARQPFSLNTTVPLNIPVSAAADNAKVFSHLLASAILQAIMSEGYNAS